MGIPQYIYLALIMLNLGVTLSKHGEPHIGKHNFWASLVTSALVIALLKWGGFF